MKPDEIRHLIQGGEHAPLCEHFLPVAARAAKDLSVQNNFLYRWVDPQGDWKNGTHGTNCEAAEQLRTEAYGKLFFVIDGLISGRYEPNEVAEDYFYKAIQNHLLNYFRSRNRRREDDVILHLLDNDGDPVECNLVELVSNDGITDSTITTTESPDRPEQIKCAVTDYQYVLEQLPKVEVPQRQQDQKARCQKIVEMLYAGHTQPEIAETLKVSPRTIRRDLHQVREWLDFLD